MKHWTTKKHHRHHCKAKTNISLSIVIWIFLICYLATAARSILVSALTADEVLAKYPDCINIDFPGLIGDGICWPHYNTKECRWDGGDCTKFNEKYPNCTVEHPSLIGNGYCNGKEYNIEACGWDGGDCVEFNEKYPDCNVHSPQWIGNDNCDGGRYNTQECGWDGGDCEPSASDSDSTANYHSSGSFEVRSLCVFMANLIIFGLVDISN